MTADRGAARLGVVGVLGLLAVAGAAYLSWLLWRYVPAHAVFFEGLRVALPSGAQAAITMSRWFVRGLPFVIVALALLGKFILVPLALRGLQRERWAVLTLAGLLTVGAGTELGLAVWVVRQMGAACQAATSDASFETELQGIRKTGTSVCVGTVAK